MKFYYIYRYFTIFEMSSIQDRSVERPTAEDRRDRELGSVVCQRLRLSPPLDHFDGH